MVSENCIPDQAVVQTLEKTYLGTCNLRVDGTTYRTDQWQTVTTPNGMAKQVCQGVIE